MNQKSGNSKFTISILDSTIGSLAIGDSAVAAGRTNGSPDVGNNTTPRVEHRSHFLHAPDVAILVALKEEWEIFWTIAGKPGGIKDEDSGRYLFHFQVPAQAGRPYRCVAVLMGTMGPGQATDATHPLLQLKPRLLVNLGIAAAIHDDLRLADVVVADQVDDYLATVKATSKGKNEWDFELRGSVYKTTYSLVQDVSSLMYAHPDAFEEWRSVCVAALAEKTDRVAKARKQGQIREAPAIEQVHLASGPVLAAAESFSRWIRTRDGLLKALEMEAAGMMLAAHQRSDPMPTLVLRGISDFGDRRKAKTDRTSGGAFRYLAMFNATQLLWAMMRRGLLPRHDLGGTRPKSSAVEQTNDASGPEEAASTKGPDTSSASLARLLLGEIARISGMDSGSTVTAREPAPSLALPTAAVLRAARSTAVNTLLEQLRNRTWVALHGSSGSGKTELALAVAETRRSVAWLPLRDLKEPEVLPRLDAALLSLVAVADRRDRAAWYEQIASTLCAEFLLVLDDLPEFDADGPLGRELIALSAAFRRHDLRLLSTGAVSLPPRLLTRLGDSVGCHPVPDFSDSEIRELLLQYGAPEQWLGDARIAYLAVATFRHAELLVTASVFLQQRSWRFSEAEFSAILHQDYAWQLASPTLRRLEATVPNDQARQLLFRATIARGDLALDDLISVSGVTPALVSPQSLLRSLEGLWLQRSQDGRFRVCPLVKNLSSELDADVRKAVHSLLGRRLLNNVMGPLEARSAILYFLDADEHNMAGVVHCRALETLCDASPEVYHADLPRIWMSTPLPEEMSLQLRLYIRALQLRYAEKVGWNTEYLIEDTLLLAEHVADDERSHLFSLLPALSVFASKHFARAAPLVIKALVGIEQLPPILSEEGKGLVAQTQPFVWHLFFWVKSTHDLETWLASIESLTAAQLSRSAQGAAYEEGCIGVCEQLLLAEAGKPKPEQDWPKLELLFGNLAVFAKRTSLSVLWASSVSARIKIFTEGLSNPSEARRIGEQALTEEWHDPRVTFLLQECLGSRLLGEGDVQKACTALRTAFATKISAFPVHRMYALGRLAQAIGDTDRQAALEATLEAISIGKSISVSKTELVKLFGEAAIAAYFVSGVAAAFPFMDTAATYLLEAKSEERAWKDLAVAFNYLLGFMMFIATTGQPPPMTFKDGEPYRAAPYGFFFRVSPERFSLYNERLHYCGLYAGVLLCADGVENDGRSLYWAQQCFHIGLHVLDAPNRLAPLMEMGIEWIKSREYLKVFNAWRDSELPEAVACLLFVFAFAHLRLSVVESGRSVDQEVEQLCCDVRAGGQHFARRDLWDERLRILKLCFQAPSSAVFSEGRGSEDFGIRFLTNITCATDFDADITRALIDQFAAYEWLVNDWTGCRNLVRRFVVPMFVAYWSRRMERAGSLFRSPSLLRDSLKGLMSEPAKGRLAALLLEVASSLGGAWPPKKHAWLRSLRNSPTPHQ
ncbi:phosphorylase family protein [Nannocystis radixulma]|uniref:Nucleoside phosphorylase domain-containing protein n=1 Tax=Nannocystis radixulma TaxID=2995305 RepID=A0ABT5BKZ7_9BACT|nr:hypothetical protein [Nannocystis radixulma]MDC0674757.1 hypothetical protein [Nannocystis radixulma]